MDFSNVIWSQVRINGTTSERLTDGNREHRKNDSICMLYLVSYFQPPHPCSLGCYLLLQQDWTPTNNWLRNRSLFDTLSPFSHMVGSSQMTRPWQLSLHEWGWCPCREKRRWSASLLLSPQEDSARRQLLWPGKYKQSPLKCAFYIFIFKGYKLAKT